MILNTQPALDQIKVDFENAKRRIILVNAMLAQGYSKDEIQDALDTMSVPDLADMILEELKNG